MGSARHARILPRDPSTEVGPAVKYASQIYAAANGVARGVYLLRPPRRLVDDGNVGNARYGVVDAHVGKAHAGKRKPERVNLA